MLLAQTFCGVIGALTSPMVYFCADKIFNNKRVSKISALSVAIFPSFVIWSSQLIKRWVNNFSFGMCDGDGSTTSEKV